MRRVANTRRHLTNEIKDR